MTAWDHTTDVLVVGSGAGGMTAAITAHSLGCDTLLVEKSASYGGSSALSGGAIWAPNNHLMRTAGVADSAEEGLTYLKHITRGKVAEDRLRAYVDHATEMLHYLEKHSHVAFQVVPEYPDYYPGAEGAKRRGGRTIEPKPFNARRLKELWADMLVPPAQELVFGKVMVSAAESKYLITPDIRARSATCALFAKYLFNPFRCFARYDTRLTLGAALIGRMRLSMAERGVPLWLNTPARQLIAEEGAVVGLKAERQGKTIRIRVRKGIILAAGGFEHNQTMREQYQQEPISAEWSCGNPDNTGDAIRMGIEIGAAVSLMEEAWWMPVTLIPGAYMPWYTKDAWWERLGKQEGAQLPWFLIIDRSLPGSIVVNSKGRRFTNEAAPYLDFGKAQRANHSEGCSTAPAYLIADHQFRKKYPLGPVMPFSSDKKYVECGLLWKSGTLAGLAEQCGIDAGGLTEQVRQYNELAAAGKDPQFHRGELSIDTYYGDKNVQPNPCIAPLNTPPYYAFRIYPGDLGTKGGLLTNADGRVLSNGGTPIEGLYATGNCAASVMGDTYPGAGGTIGPSMIFGYIAARHAAAQ